MRPRARISLLAAAAVLLPACGLEPADRTGKVESPLVEPERPAAPSGSAASVDGKRDAPPGPASGCRKVLGLLHARRFTLEEPHEYRWMKDHPPITSGTLVVLEVEPECARPRQVAEPVLHAGKVPVEIVKDAYPSGRLVVIVPGHVDLSETPLFYGAPELPERVDGEHGARELAAALAEGIEPFAAGVVDAAGGGDLDLAGTTELYEAALDMDVRYRGARVEEPTSNE